MSDFFKGQPPGYSAEELAELKRGDSLIKKYRIVVEATPGAVAIPSPLFTCILPRLDYPVNILKKFKVALYWTNLAGGNMKEELPVAAFWTTPNAVAQAIDVTFGGSIATAINSSTLKRARTNYYFNGGNVGPINGGEWEEQYDVFIEREGPNTIVIDIANSNGFGLGLGDTITAVIEIVFEHKGRKIGN